ncbi:Uncharacterised protein [Mycobacterium tuberculosis]|nr:Uncharacterised protein [Mycobacterium tuberculosis]COZ30410.1 Uncharacterised protein [Mycobacterium tuberculosis]
MRSPPDDRKRGGAGRWGYLPLAGDRSSASVASFQPATSSNGISTVVNNTSTTAMPSTPRV